MTTFREFRSVLFDLVRLGKGLVDLRNEVTALHERSGGVSHGPLCVVGRLVSEFEVGNSDVSPACLGSQGFQFDPTFLYLLFCSSA